VVFWVVRLYDDVLGSTSLQGVKAVKVLHNTVTVFDTTDQCVFKRNLY